MCNRFTYHYIHYVIINMICVTVLIISNIISNIISISKLSNSLPLPLPFLPFYFFSLLLFFIFGQCELCIYLVFGTFFDLLLILLFKPFNIVDIIFNYFGFVKGLGVRHGIIADWWLGTLATGLVFSQGKPVSTSLTAVSQQ